MSTLRKMFPLIYLHTLWIDEFDGYDNYIGEKALVIPAGCGGNGYNVRKIEAYPYPKSFMDDCIQVSYSDARAEDGVQMCGPRADPHHVIPVSCIRRIVNMGIDILNTRKREMLEEFPEEKRLEYAWREEPAREAWFYISKLCEHADIRFTDNDTWQEFRKNGDVRHIGEHV